MTDKMTMNELYTALVNRLAFDMAQDTRACVRALADEYDWTEEQQETLAVCIAKLNLLTFVRTTEMLQEFQGELQRNERIGFVK